MAASTFVASARRQVARRSGSPLRRARAGGPPPDDTNQATSRTGPPPEGRPRAGERGQRRSLSPRRERATPSRGADVARADRRHHREGPGIVDRLPRGAVEVSSESPDDEPRESTTPRRSPRAGARAHRPSRPPTDPRGGTHLHHCVPERRASRAAFPADLVGDPRLLGARSVNVYPPPERPAHDEPRSSPRPR